MKLGYKEQLSAHVEKIFKGYITPGLHICDIATGGGKSYTIGKLTCEFYPLHFDRIIILCVQNKLVNGMDREIERFISTPESKIKPKDKNEDNVEKDIYEIMDMLRFGFGRWNEMMTYPFPFKFLQEYLDDASEIAFSKHWSEITVKGQM